MKKFYLIIMIVFFYCFVFSQEIQWVIFEDDFESYPSGQFPASNWLPWHNCSTDPTNNIVTTSQAYTGSKSLQVYGSHYGCWSATAAHLINQLPETLQVEAYLRASGEAGTGTCGHSDIELRLDHHTEASSNNNLLSIFFASDDMNIHFGLTGTGGGILQSFVNNQWYHVKYELNTINYTFKAWIDGNLFGPYSWNVSSLPYPLSEYRAITVASGDGKGWADDLKIIDTGVSINEFTTDNNCISIYPNPIVDVLNIKSSIDISYINIIDLQGKLIYESKFKSEINFSTLDKGIYVLTFYSKNGNIIKTEKFAKK